GPLNNPLTQRLVASAQKDAPELGMEADRIASALVLGHSIHGYASNDARPQNQVEEVLRGLRASAASAKTELTSESVASPEARVAQLKQQVQFAEQAEKKAMPSGRGGRGAT